MMSGEKVDQQGESDTARTTVSDEQRGSHVHDLGRVADLVKSLRSGVLRSRDLVQTCLDRITAVDGAVHAWCDIFDREALQEADRLDGEAAEGRWRGPLHGVPLGVKDIIDIAGKPTRAGSAILADARPADLDAAVVSTLRTAGVVIIGKTHTTEFAQVDPAPTRNPHNLDHTPGGSSSGSAAAVAAGTVPLALGTQTTGSVNRPAAFCGVGSFKPSIHLLSTFGVRAGAPSFDAVGCFGQTVRDAVLLFQAMCPTHAWPVHRQAAGTRARRFARPDDPLLLEIDSEAHAVVEELAGHLARTGYWIEHTKMPVPFAALVADHEVIETFEFSRTHVWLLQDHATELGARVRDTIETGLKVSVSDYLGARRRITEAAARFWATLDHVDAFLCAPCAGTAPLGHRTTGDPRFLAPWTSLGGPMATLPVAAASNGLPLSVMVTSRPGSDLLLGAIACDIESSLAAHQD
jgi:aspartyl-tRNA(Asn)/glutamyl-tRNA(Gln) amidotransferase subunit A